MDFFIKGWHFWPTEPGPDAGASDQTSVDPAWPVLPQVPSMQRRRLSPLTKIAFDVAFSQAIDAATPLVFASRHGDLPKTAELLLDVVQCQPLSPTQFALSVHNAIVGQYSIFQQHQAAHSSVAGGDSSLHYALLEAFGLLRQQDVTQVLVFYADLPVPELYRHFCQQPATAKAVALLLSNTEGQAMRLNYLPTLNQPSQDEVVALQDFLQSSQPSCAIQTHSAGWQWQRRHDVAEA